MVDGGLVPPEGDGLASPDASRSRACGTCGWAGPETSMADAGDPLRLACPRCGEPVAPDLPSADEVRAARRSPEP